MTLNPPRLTTAILIGGGVVLIGVGLWAGLQPRYQATARIKIVGDSPYFEPRWRGKELPQEIQAGIADVYNYLGVAIESLPPEWAEVKLPEAAAWTRRNLEVNPIPGTSLIEIKVASRNPEAAAHIANQIAAVNGSRLHVQIVNSATAPTKRVFPNFGFGLKFIGLATILLGAGLFILFDRRRFPEAWPACFFTG